MTNILLARGSSHARGKRPPATEINSFNSYPKNADLRTNIYFAPERLLRYSTDMSCTSSVQEPPAESVVYFGKLLHSLYQLRNLKAATLFGGSSKRRPSPEKS